MNGVSAFKVGFIDLAAILFVIGGVVSFVMTVLTIPIASIYPLRLPTSLSTVSLVMLVIGLVCSLGAIRCYSLTVRRVLSDAGIKGTIFGALLTIFSLGLFGSYAEPGASTLLTTVSAILILLAGARGRSS